MNDALNNGKLVELTAGSSLFMGSRTFGGTWPSSSRLFRTTHHCLDLCTTCRNMFTNNFSHTGWCFIHLSWANSVNKTLLLWERRYALKKKKKNLRKRPVIAVWPVSQTHFNLFDLICIKLLADFTDFFLYRALMSNRLYKTKRLH